MRFGVRTPARLRVTNSLTWARAVAGAGIKQHAAHRNDSVLADSHPLDPDNRSSELSQQFYERRLKVDALSLLDARALLMGQARRHEVRR
jgi:hypothetical protein